MAWEALWILFVVLATLIQDTTTDGASMSEKVDDKLDDILNGKLDDILNDKSDDKLEDVPLSKSLGYAIRKGFGSNTLEEAKMNKEYMFQYNDMVKASQEAFENFARKDERRLRRVVGEHNYEMMKEAGVLDRRRNTRLLESAAGQRRARTQAVRRQKLNSQSLKSHLAHSRSSTDDYAADGAA